MNPAIAFGGAAAFARPGTAGSSGGSNAGAPMDPNVSAPAAGGAAPIASSAAAPSGGGSMLSLGALAQNPYFSAGAGLYTLGAIAFVGRFAMKIATTAVKRRFVVSMETTSRDPSHEWLMQWLARHPSFSFQQLSIMTSNVTIHANEETTSNHIFAPCPNVAHYLSHHGWPIVVHRKRQVERASGQDVLETLEMYTIGRSPKIMQEIVAEAKSQAVERDSDRTVIYHNTGGRWSRQQEARSRRPIGSVVLDGGMRQALVSDVRQFLDSSSYYTRLGVPYRRGYLMHGPPGCGKSSFVTALAGEMRLAICVLSLSNRSLDDESLNNLLNTAPLRSIVLLEDIDRAFTSDSRVTMSGLLNALDGVAAQEGRIVFMTTNHVDRLDPALIRPGRADVKVEIGLLAKAQAVELFRKFFPEAPETIVKDFEATIPDRTVSPAQLQSHLFLHRNSAQEAVYTLESFVEELRAFDAKVRAEQERANRARNFRPPPML